MKLLLLFLVFGGEPIFRAAPQKPVEPPRMEQPAIVPPKAELTPKEEADKLLQILEDLSYKTSNPERDLPELWMFVDHSPESQKAMESLSLVPNSAENRWESTTPFRVILLIKVPAFLQSSITEFPAFYWPDKQDKVRGCKSAKILKGWKSKEFLIEQWKRSRSEPVKTSAKAPQERRIYFGSPNWTYNGGHVTLNHLRYHGVPEWVIQKYKHDQRALDMLHGACHERGSVF